jgi:hypothetical protein
MTTVKCGATENEKPRISGLFRGFYQTRKKLSVTKSLSSDKTPINKGPELRTGFIYIRLSFQCNNL